MTRSALTDDRLRQAISALAGSTPSTVDCPKTDEIWMAACGELTVVRLREVGLHATACPACAESWQLARELRVEPQPRVVPFERSKRAGDSRRRLWLGALAAAAALVLVLMLPRESRFSPDADSPFRGGEDLIRSLTASDSPLPRTAFALAWEGPAGSRYDLRVATEDLRILDEVFELEKGSYTVDPDRLADLAPGTRVIWQVHATGPDGRRLSSRSFVQVLE